MITGGELLVDKGLYDAAPVIRGGLLLFRSQVVDVAARSETSEPCDDIDALVAGARHSAGYGPADLVRQLRPAAPALGIFVVAKRGELSFSERQRLVTLGVDRVLDLEALSKKRLESLIKRRVNAPAPKRALAALSLVRFHPTVAPLVQWVLRNACYRLSIEDAADVFKLSSRTIRRRLDQQGVPGYHILKSFGLEMHVLELEVCRGRTRVEVARRLGYRDTTRLSRLLQPDSSHRNGEPTWFTDLRDLYL